MRGAVCWGDVMSPSSRGELEGARDRDESWDRMS